MPKDFAVYYRGRHLKETSKNQLLLTLGESLTMKQYHNPTNKSDGIFPVSFSVRSPFVLRSFSVHPPFELRSSSVRSPFVLRSFSVHPPFELRSSSVHPPFELRSSSVRAPFGNRRSIEDWSKNERGIIGGKTEMYRNSNGKPRERRPEQKLYFLSLKFKLLWQDLLELFPNSKVL